MTKEDYVKELISQSGHNIKSFAQSIELPYTTMLGMLNRGLDGASVQNVIRVCKGLGIVVEDLERIEGGDFKVPFYVSELEKKMLERYRNKPELQQAVNILLGLNEE